MLCFTSEKIEDPTAFVYVPDDGRHAEVLQAHNIRIIPDHNAQESGG
jgi:hypothetical protein